MSARHAKCAAPARAMWVALALTGSFMLTLLVSPGLCRVAFRKGCEPIAPRGPCCEHHGALRMKLVKAFIHHVCSAAAIQQLLPRLER